MIVCLNIGNEEDTDGDKRGMPVCGDYHAGMWGGGVALG